MEDSILSPISELPDHLAFLSQQPSLSSTTTVVQDLAYLKRTWPRIQAVLSDAEEMELVNVSVRRWLCELKDLAHDAEDVLDDYEYEKRRAEVDREIQKQDRLIQLELGEGTDLADEMQYLLIRLRLFNILRSGRLPVDVLGGYLCKRHWAKMLPSPDPLYLLRMFYDYAYEMLQANVEKNSIQNLLIELWLGDLKRLGNYTQNMYGDDLYEILLSKMAERKMHDILIKLWLHELSCHNVSDVFGDSKYEKLQFKVLESPNLLRLLLPRIGVELEGTATPTVQTILHKKQKRDEVFGLIPSSLLTEPFCQHIACRVRIIRERFNEIAKQRDAHHLREGDGEKRSNVRKGACTVSFLSEKTRIYGRDDDKKEIVELLLSGKHGKSNVDVIVLTGTGGIGKTTLAQLVYNDKRIRSHFDTMGWVCISEEFDVMRLTKAAIESLTMEPCQQFTQLEPLQNILVNKLKGKKFLFVLDDVWTETNELHDSLIQVPLDVGAKGSKILLTTRNDHVSQKIMRPSTTRCLRLLSDDDCWDLFKGHAFDDRYPEDRQIELVAIGLEIVKKCHGLPLAAKVLGDLMRSKAGDEEKWREILESSVWEIEDGKNKILAPLKLSYNYLPMHLKQCFIYSSVYPKDYQFDKDELVRLWMAQGLIRSQGRKQMEDVGSEYFEDLLQRSFFQQKYLYSGEFGFVVHDLMHDLAQYILQEGCSLLRDGISQTTVHLPLLPNDSLILTKCHASYESRIGRTFIGCWYPLIPTRIQDLILQLTYLRVLDLNDLRLTTLPDSIGNLKHLRYLGLRGSLISYLPESICMLYNLETLDLRNSHILSLPIGMEKLTHLRHLFISKNGAASQVVMVHSGIGKLTNLQTLDSFHLQSNICVLADLGHLTGLRGELRVTGLCNVVKAEVANVAKLNGKEHLRKLVLDWSESSQGVPYWYMPNPEKILENLRPHYNLIELQINWFYGVAFPDWFGDRSFSKLTKVEIHYCKECVVLPGLGQLPSLQHVEISGLPSLRHVEDGEFHSLQRLGIKDCPQLFCNLQAKDLPSFFRQPKQKFQYLEITCCPFLGDWCRRHACVELEHVCELLVDGYLFYYPRCGDRTFRVYSKGSGSFLIQDMSILIED